MARIGEGIAPHYPKAGQGRRPYPLSMMLRIHFLQQWFHLSDPRMEDALSTMSFMRHFAGISLMKDAIPDETTILNFRHRLEKHNLGKELFAAVAHDLKKYGMVAQEGTIVDCNHHSCVHFDQKPEKTRDPEMHSTKKGNQWSFDMCPIPCLCSVNCSAVVC